MTDKHTTGPWTLRNVGSLCWPDVFSFDGRRICSYVRAEYDARLIVTAPKLLACLEKAASSNYHSTPEIAEWILAIREARGIAPTEPKP
jgi:hypothetical protein